MPLKRLWIGLLFFLFIGSLDAYSDVSSSSEFVEFHHLEENILFLKQASTTIPTAKDPELKPLKTGLFDTKYLGTLQPHDGGSPYFLVIGKPCQNCPDEQAVYILRSTGDNPTGFVYPGKIFDPKTRAVLLESRAFFGKCLRDREDVYVVFQKEKVDRKSHLQPSVLVVEAEKAHLSESLVERHFPPLNRTLQMVKKKICHEIEGRKRLMLRKPLNLHPKENSDNEDDDDEEEDAPTEKVQTDNILTDAASPIVVNPRLPARPADHQ
jgi:hypothetical protein